MRLSTSSPLADMEPRLRWLLPADLYAAAWIDSSPANLMRIFEHLRSLQHILSDYTPEQVHMTSPQPGEVRYEWEECTLMFTDLAGFTPLLEAHAAYGRSGAQALLVVLNSYFTEMIQIISKSGGNLLEFTGDAMLIQFRKGRAQNETAQAIRAGLRMQRAMAQKFSSIETTQGVIALGMRIGIHCGRFLTANIGTPRRMQHVLLGIDVQRTKRAESMGQAGRVCVSEKALASALNLFRFESGRPGYGFVVDDFSTEALGEYEIALGRRRVSSPVLLDRSEAGLLQTIEEALQRAEPLASYLPRPILGLLVEYATRRKIRPEFPELTVVFVNLIGVPGSANRAPPGEEAGVVAALSRAFTLINAAVEARGGVLKGVSCDHMGSSMLIYFGMPDTYINDSMRAAAVALHIQEIVQNFGPLIAGENAIFAKCQIGLSRGPVFAAEIGEPRGRREFNILGDTVNTAARLMCRAGENQILLTEPVYQAIAHRFTCERLPATTLKGKALPVAIFLLRSQQDEHL